MTKEEILSSIQEAMAYASRKKELEERIVSVKMADLTIQSRDRVLTPDDQAKILYQEWASMSDMENQIIEALESLSELELLAAYADMLKRPKSMEREIILGYLARLIANINKERKR